jgi:hypothetical protein
LNISTANLTDTIHKHQVWKSIDFEEFRAIGKQLHENLNDDDIMEMMHSAAVNHKTSSNEVFSFE